MNVLFSLIACYIVLYIIEYLLNLSESRMKISITCSRRTSNLMLIAHSIMGGYVKGCTNAIEHKKKFNFLCVPYLIRWRFKGIILYEIQSKPVLSDNNFVIIGWEVPIFGAPKINPIVVETGDQKLDWNNKFLEEKYDSLCVQLMHSFNNSIKTWSLSSGKKITLSSELAYIDKTYMLNIIVDGEVLNGIRVDAPVHIEP
jgi:hypothetical protein